MAPKSDAGSKPGSATRKLNLGGDEDEFEDLGKGQAPAPISTDADKLRALVGSADVLPSCLTQSKHGSARTQLLVRAFVWGDVAAARDVLAWRNSITIRAMPPYMLFKLHFIAAGMPHQEAVQTDFNTKQKSQATQLGKLERQLAAVSGRLDDHKEGEHKAHGKQLVALGEKVGAHTRQLADYTDALASCKRTYESLQQQVTILRDEMRERGVETSSKFELLQALSTTLSSHISTGGVASAEGLQELHRTMHRLESMLLACVGADEDEQPPSDGGAAQQQQQQQQAAAPLPVSQQQQQAAAPQPAPQQQQQAAAPQQQQQAAAPQPAPQQQAVLGQQPTLAAIVATAPAAQPVHTAAPPAAAPGLATAALGTGNEAMDAPGAGASTSTVGAGSVMGFKPPALPKPASFSGNGGADVDETLFRYEAYLAGSRIPKQDWPAHAMQLLEGKALSAWTAVAMPASKAGTPVTWEMFTEVMLKAFAHPDREHSARLQLYKVQQNNNQAASEYVRYFNSLAVRCGNDPPKQQELINFFYSGLSHALKEKCAVNHKTGKFWTDLKALQDHTIALSTHAPKIELSMRSAGVQKRRGRGALFNRGGFSQRGRHHGPHNTTLAAMQGSQRGGGRFGRGGRTFGHGKAPRHPEGSMEALNSQEGYYKRRLLEIEEEKKNKMQKN